MMTCVRRPFFTMPVVNRTNRIHTRLVSMVNHCMNMAREVGGGVLKFETLRKFFL
jgi:hypothetical protein